MEEHEYGDEHKKFVQILLSRRVVSEKEAVETIRRLKRDEKADVEKFRKQINQTLTTAARLEVRRAWCEANTEFVWGIANTVCDEVSKMASYHAGNDANLLSNVISACMTSPDGKCSKSHLRTLAPEKMTQVAAEAAWDAFVTEGWLISVGGRDDVTVGPRSLIDLKPVLEREEAHLPRCLICEDIALLADHCPNERCSVRLHTKCATDLFRRTERKCPTCKQPWQRR